MHTQNDFLSDLETEKKEVGKIFVITICIYLMQIVSAALYLQWLFHKPIWELLTDTQETQILLFINFIYPVVAFCFFIARKKIGWALVVFSSILNVTYAVFIYFYEQQIDILLLFFMMHAVLLGFLFQKSLIEKFNTSKKFFTWTVYSSVTVAILFLLLAVTTSI